MPIQKRRLPYQSAPIADHTTTVTVAINTKALEVMIANPGKIAARTLQTIAVDIVDNGLPIPVRSALVDYFEVFVEYDHKDGTSWKHNFLVNTQSTVYDLACAVEQATGAKKSEQMLLMPNKRRSNTMRQGRILFRPGAVESATRTMGSLGLRGGEIIFLTRTTDQPDGDETELDTDGEYNQ